MATGDYFVYHEKQDSSLCGQHALNTLLQGPYFTAVDLADIARQIDAKEKELMLANGTDTEDAIKFLAEDSGNVNDSGFFSVEVLRAAVDRFGELKLISAESSEIDSMNIDSEKAFICNRSEHWFTVRRIGETWYNLNSLSDQPEVISDFFLSAFLTQLRHDGYSVFIVRGPGLPDHGFPDDVDGVGRWFHATELTRATGAKSGRSEGKDKDASDAQKKAKTEEPEDYWAKLGRGNQLGGQSLGGGGQASSAGRTLGGAGSGAGADEDEDLARAIALSMAES